MWVRLGLWRPPGEPEEGGWGEAGATGPRNPLPRGPSPAHAMTQGLDLSSSIYRALIFFQVISQLLF